jgi:ATP-binding cassette subfamily B protein RaxB
MSLDATRLTHRSRLRPILQTEGAECGLACLAMVAGYHGLSTDLPTLRQQHSLSLKGANLVRLIDIAGRMGLNARALRLEMDELVQLKTPCVLHWDMNHFVVLKSVDSKRVVILDPAHGERTLSLKEASRHFTGVALELEPGADFRAGEARQRVTLRQLLGQVSGLKRALVTILALALVLELFVLVMPFHMQWMIDHALVTSDRSLVTVLGVAFLMLVAFQAAVSAARSWAVGYLGIHLNLQWTANVFAHLLRLPIDFFEKRHLGDVVSRFGSLQAIQRALTTSFIEALLDGLLGVVTLVVMCLYAPLLAAVAVGAVLLYLGLRLALYAPLREATEQQIVCGAKAQSHLLESVRGVQTIKLADRAADRRGRFFNLNVDTANREFSIVRLGVGFGAANRLLFGAERIIVIWLGALAVLDAQFSVGMLVAFLAYKDQFSSRTAALIEKLFELRMLRLHGERLADIALSTPESDEAEVRAASASTELRPALSVKNLSYRYAEGEPWVIKDLDLEIEEGESVAIIGASGCGKTTLLKLMLGLLKPVQGEVLVDGQPLQRVGMRRYRGMLGAVMQEDQLFAGSLSDNIALFDPEADQQRIEAAARMAAVHEDIAAMPMGYNTLIGDMGTSLSGGQKQRVLLARALYRQPKLLFLDEATSHLDVERERLVNDAVKQMQVTRIIIAHRPETIHSADRVVVMHGGRIVQTFRPRDLLRPAEAGQHPLSQPQAQTPPAGPAPTAAALAG